MRTETVEIEVLSAESPVNMANQWYEHVAADHFWMQWRLDVLRSLMEKQNLGNDLLEVGCGNCIARNQLEDVLSLPIAGCDLNRSSMELAEPGRGRLYLYDIFDRRPEWLEHFSTVFLLDTLEHIERPNEFLSAVRDHLQPQGFLVINVPALQSLYGKYDDLVGHVKRYDKNVLTRELTASGFELVACRYWGLSTIPVVAARKALGMLWKRDRIVEKGIAPSRIADLFLRSLMKLEQATVPRPPVGTSLAAIARKL
jgi:2-polyprenyl-3-methyl-5-hydroxy-6-metoxy-1,4-benzoquinol methylase